MRDRLSSLWQIATTPLSQRDSAIDIVDAGEFKDAFADDLSALKSAVARLERLADDLDRENRRVMAAYDDATVVTAEQHISAIEGQFSSSANALRSKLKALVVEQRGSANGFDTKRKQSALQSLTKRFLEVVRRFEQTQERHADKKKSRLRRQVLLVNPNLPHEEVERVLSGEAGVSAQVLFSPTKSPVLDPAKLKAAQTELAYMQERLAEMRKLEQGVSELRALMADIALLVAQQGETLERLEDYVRSTEEYVASGKTALRETVVSAALAQKRKFWSLITSVCVVVVVVICASASMYLQDAMFKAMSFVIFCVVVLGAYLVYRVYSSFSPIRSIMPSPV